MLVMGCVLMVQFKLMLFDEFLMGLVFIFINEIFEIIKVINQVGMMVLLIE